MNKLYYDCLTHILCHVTKKDVYNLAQVNRYYATTLRENRSWTKLVKPENSPKYYLTKTSKDSRVSEYSYFICKKAFRNYLVIHHNFRQLVLNNIFWSQGIKIDLLDKNNLNLMIDYLLKNPIVTKSGTYFTKRH